MEKVTVKSNKVVVKTADEEKWRKSSLYPEIEVSSKGRVKERDYRLVLKHASKDSFRIYDVPAKMLETKVSASGDVVVCFTNSAGHLITQDVATLVATEFVTNEDPSRYNRIKFKDRDKTNLNASNLYWDGIGLSTMRR